jgi:hypothetical protein
MTRQFLTWRRLGGGAFPVCLVVAAALLGGAGTSQAATNFTITLAPLIGTPGVNTEIPQVSYGGKIGYHLHIENNDTSNTQHASVRVTSDLATFSDADDPSCAVNPKNPHEMVCTPFGGTFSPGAIFDVNLRFTAPTSGPDIGETVKTCASITVSAQTVKNGNKDNGTTAATTCPTGFDDPGALLTNVVENTDKADTYLHKGESAGTSKPAGTHLQNFVLTLPDTLFGDPFGIALSIHDNSGKICATCLNSYTALTIPVAAFAVQNGNPFPGNPFYDGTPNVHAYSWSMNAQYPSNNKPSQIIHIDDNGDPHTLKKCSDIGGPTADEPMCYDTFDPTAGNGPQGTKIASATGHGIENGNIGYG